MKKVLVLFSLLILTSIDAKVVKKQVVAPLKDTTPSAITFFTPNSFRVDFNQDFLSVTGKVKSSKGSLEYLFPGNLRLKEFKDNTEFVSNQKSSWYYVPPFIKGEKGTVQINQSGSMVLGKVFDSLRPGLVDTEYFKIKKNTLDAKLDFTDKGKTEWKLENAVLYFSKNDSGLTMNYLQKLELTYTDKKKVTLTFFNYTGDVQFPKDYFIFQIPEKTQILR